SFNTGHNYVIGNSLVGGVAISELANPDITWETTTITDIGLDMNFLDNKITIVADWFDKTSTDVLLRLPIPLTVGVDLAPYQNIGEVQNVGWELAIGYQDNFGELSFFANANISQIKNEIIDIGGREDWIDGTFHAINKVGSPIGSFYGLVADGYFAESDFDVDGNLNADIATQYGNLKPGDIKYKDISGPDGVPDGVISEDYDREIVGNPFPEFTYGFTIGAKYKGFDLSMFFQGAQGVDRWQWYNNEADGNYTEAILDYWTPTNTSAAYPSLGNSDNNAKWSSFWIEDASYLRLKNLEIGYTLPKKLSERAKISRARIYFTGYNLLTFTKMPDYDPERRADDVRAGSYAQAKVFSFGLNLTF
ncbi:MAG: TonB-dependent receptor, partial [Bacteroidetes bacterium]